MAGTQAANRAVYVSIAAGSCRIWPEKEMERDTGFEPATSSLGSCDAPVLKDCESRTYAGAVGQDAPNTSPQIEKPVKTDPKSVLLEALRAVDRDTLLAVLAEALTGKGTGA